MKVEHKKKMRVGRGRWYEKADRRRSMVSKSNVDWTAVYGVQEAYYDTHRRSHVGLTKGECAGWTTSSDGKGCHRFGQYFEFIIYSPQREDMTRVLSIACDFVVCQLEAYYEPGVDRMYVLRGYFIFRKHTMMSYVISRIGFIGMRKRTCMTRMMREFKDVIPLAGPWSLGACHEYYCSRAKKYCYDLGYGQGVAPLCSNLERLAGQLRIEGEEVNNDLGWCGGIQVDYNTYIEFWSCKQCEVDPEKNDMADDVFYYTRVLFETTFEESWFGDVYVGMELE